MLLLHLLFPICVEINKLKQVKENKEIKKPKVSPDYAIDCHIIRETTKLTAGHNMHNH